MKLPSLKSSYAIASLAVFMFSLLSPKWVLAPAAWLGPPLLLLLVHRLRPGRSLLAGMGVLWLANLIAGYGVMPFPTLVFVVMALVGAVIKTVPYIIHRLAAPHVSLSARLVIFPAALVVVEFLDGFGGGGTWNSLAYTQVEFAPLMQLASVTGIWGITFLIGWFAALLFETATAPAFTRPPWQFLVFAVVVASAWVFGAFRTHPYFQRDGYTVRTAGITYNNAALLKAMYHDAFGAAVDIDEDGLTQNSPELQTLQKGFVHFIENPDSLKFKITYRAMSRQQDSLLALAAREAEAGARLIVFSEAAFIMPKHMEETFRQRAAAVTSRYHVWLVAGVAAIRTGKIETGKPFIENKLMVWDSEGKLIHTFYKNKPVPLVEPSIAGDGAVPVIDTPFGRMALSICYDADFPALMRKAGRQRADMLVLPSGDWREIAPYHARMAAVRAIENGFSLVRPVNGAHSIVTNSNGAVTGASNFYATGGKVFVANVPINTRKTLYASIGDVLPCVCIPVLVALVAYSFVRRRRS